MGKKPSKKIIVLAAVVMLLVSCRQSCFDVLTHNDVGYWSRYWTPNDPHGAITEYSKKDSTTKYLNECWAYNDFAPALWGLKFKMANDTLFKYVNRKGNLKIYDTIPIASYSKNTVILKNGIVWHRISTKYARKMLNAPDQVKLSSILKKRDHDRKITNITGIVWKLYGYGDVSTGIVKKSEYLKKDWKCVIKLWESGTVSGISCYDDLRGKYALSGSNIEFLSIEKRVDGRDDDNGNDFCDALLQCKRFKLTNNWLQLFYNDGKNYLLFMVAKNFKENEDLNRKRKSLIY